LYVPICIRPQVANQSFNALVNYSNRNTSTEVNETQLATAFAAATTSSVGVALLFNKIVQSSPTLSAGIIGRFVPFAAVAAANCANIPLMRQQVRVCSVAHLNNVCTARTPSLTTTIFFFSLLCFVAWVALVNRKSRME
jgi:hypothetical protein